MNSTTPSTRPEEAVQGEGNYDATRRYDKATREFVEAGKVEGAAQAAKPADAAEAESLERAEREGRSHSKGEDSGMKKEDETGGRAKR